VEVERDDDATVFVLPTLTTMTDPIAERLHAAFLAAYRPYVESLLAERGMPSVPEAVAAGERWLDETLGELLALPAREQPRSPLEVFQEALRFPTEALEESGVAPVGRDEAAEAALPGDLFDLAPASSQALGEEAWRAHLEWGAAKAARIGPLAVAFTRSLMDASRIESAGSAAGFRVVTAGGPGALPGSGVVVAFVDLEHPDADEAVRQLAGLAGRVIAYGPHVDDMAMVRARALGAADALPRSQFFKDPASHFPTVA
jgi:hypothetical protein